MRFTCEKSTLNEAVSVCSHAVGSRGTSPVMEGLLTQLMFDIPSDPTVEKVLLTAACITEGAKPDIIYNPDKKNRRLPPVKGKAAPRRKTANG